MERKTHIMRVHHFARGQRSRSATRAWSENGKAGSLAVPEPLISMLLLAQTFVQQCGEPTPIKTNLAKKKKRKV